MVAKLAEPKPDIFIGLDPGVNFGITFITGPQVLICNGKLPAREEKWKHGLDAYEFIQKHVLRYNKSGNRCWAVVEGASFGDVYGQVPLESVRMGFCKGLVDRGCEVKVSPPATIRAGALGGGKNTAFDIWPLLNHNAADSLGAALYAYSLG